MVNGYFICVTSKTRNIKTPVVTFSCHQTWQILYKVPPSSVERLWTVLPLFSPILITLIIRCDCSLWVVARVRHRDVCEDGGSEIAGQVTRGYTTLGRGKT